MLEGRLVAPPDARAVVVLLHGIPGGLHDPSDPGYAGLAEQLASAGYAAAHFDFRGVRGQPGDFSFSGWQQDLAAALDAVESGATAGLRKVVVGSSAGGAVAIASSARRTDVTAVATLATPATFDLPDDLEGVLLRFRNLGIIHDPGFPADTHAWRNEFVSDAPELRVADIAPRPILIVHGDADEVVPYAHAERLYAAAGSPKELVRIPQGRHRLRRDPRAVDALVDWLDQVAG